MFALHGVSAESRTFTMREELRAMKKKFPAINNPKPEVIVIHCSDPRFRIAFRRFISRRLKLVGGKFVPINIAGGPAALANRETKLGEWHFLVGQIMFFLSHFETVKKIVVIGHEDCGYYKTVYTAGDDREKRDLPKAASSLRIELARKPATCDVEVACYFASFADENRTQIVIEEA